jgi:hypothetical protein
MYLRALGKSVGYDAVAGAWLFGSAFLMNGSAEHLFVNNVTCGALAMVLAFGPFAHVWLAWLPVAIGAWVMVSPLALGFTGDAFATANNVVTGIVMFLSAVESYAVTSSARDAGVTGD